MDADIISAFHNARRPEYDELSDHLDGLIATLPAEATQKMRLEALEALANFVTSLSL